MVPGLRIMGGADDEKTVKQGDGAMSVSKIFVGVHGIGDQTECETIQTIIEQVTGYQGSALRVPLGKISSALTSEGVYLCPDLAVPGSYLGFAEVYWADIPRQVVEQGYVLEETTRWAGALVEKLDREYGTPLAQADKEAISSILPEAVESVRVLKRLFQVAEWGGKFKFDLDSMLDSYLGDVQFVTEFAQLRCDILKRFHLAIEAAAGNHPGAEIYIVAHSEGTVVAFLGLLEALSSKVAAPWLKKVKGFMTIGSPIDKHLILWPELWAGLKPSHPREEKIAWYNYYDLGDPVGFELNTARFWLGDDSPFRFDKKMDKGFARYLLPGKAHLDYWQDRALFGDFFKLTGLARGGASAAPAKLKSRSLAGLFSCLLPYLLAFGLLSTGVVIFYNTVIICIAEEVRAISMLLDVIAFSALLAGMGVAARIPRLIRDFRWHLWSLITAGLLFGLFWFTVDQAVCQWLSEPLGLNVEEPRLPVLGIAGAILFVSYIYNLVSRRSGVWFMVAAGSLSIMALVLAKIFTDADHKEIFPVLIGGAAFLYLWWLAVLVFDLSFIWHQYIRNSLALHRMKDCFHKRYRQPFVTRKFVMKKKFMA